MSAQNEKIRLKEVSSRKLIGKILKTMLKKCRKVKAKCSHFPACGGCAFQDVNYDDQLEIKEEIIKQSFLAHGIDLEKQAAKGELAYENIIPCREIFFYRNRMDYVIAYGKIGLRKRGSFKNVVDIEDCYLLSEYGNEVIKKMREFIRSYNIETHDIVEKTGLLRYLIIRHAKNSDEKMINILTFKKEFPHADKLGEIFIDATSIIWSRSNAVADVSYGEEYEVIKGREYILENLLGYSFAIYPFSFFQTNTKQSELLFRKAIALAELKGEEEALDLYSGSGVIGILIADKVKKVIGIESDENSVKAAEKNFEINKIKNMTMLKEKAEKIMSEVKMHANIIFADPPRAGMHKKVIKALIKNRADKIIYISCNPVTLARDCAALNHAYKISFIQGIDMFPHTAHVECIALLERK